MCSGSHTQKWQSLMMYPIGLIKIDWGFGVPKGRKKKASTTEGSKCIGPGVNNDLAPSICNLLILITYKLYTGFFVKPWVPILENSSLGVTLIVPNISVFCFKLQMFYHSFVWIFVQVTYHNKGVSQIVLPCETVWRCDLFWEPEIYI